MLMNSRHRDFVSLRWQGLLLLVFALFAFIWTLLLTLEPVGKEIQSQVDYLSAAETFAMPLGTNFTAVVAMNDSLTVACKDLATLTLYKWEGAYTTMAVGRPTIT